MADLDDFFAKKDKKKGGKKTTKTATSDVTAKSTGAGSTKVVGTNIKPSILKDDDEWITPEEKVVDYSGLRIQDLSVAETANAEEEAEQEAKQQSAAKKWAVSKPAAEPTSTFNFPSLQHATQDAGAPPPPGMKNFKPVKNGYKGDGVVRQGERVALSNRYAGLGE